MENRELRSFINLFDAWYDAIFLLRKRQNSLRFLLGQNEELYKIDTLQISEEEKKKVSNVKNCSIFVEKYDSKTALLDEIKSNLLTIDQSDREAYLVFALKEIAPLYKFFHPENVDEGEYNLHSVSYEVVPGRNIINDIWDSYQKDKKRTTSFLVNYIIECREKSLEFACELDIIAMHFKLDIEYIQDRHSIRIRDKRDYSSLQIYGNFSSDYIIDVEKMYRKKDIIATNNKKEKQSLTFKDIFKSEESHLNILKWLKQNDFMNNHDTFDLEASEFVVLILALYAKGLLKEKPKGAWIGRLMKSVSLQMSDRQICRIMSEHEGHDYNSKKLTPKFYNIPAI